MNLIDGYIGVAPRPVVVNTVNVSDTRCKVLLFATRSSR